MNVSCPIENCDWDGDINYFGSHFRMKASHQGRHGDHAQHVTHDDDVENSSKPDEDASEDSKPTIEDSMEKAYGNTDEDVEAQDEEENVVSYDSSEGSTETSYRALNPDNPVEEKLLMKGLEEIEDTTEKPLKERDVR